MKTRAQRNHLYRHFKGETYIVHYVGKHTETEENLVVYQKWESCPVGQIWIRPLSEFQGSRPKGPRWARFTHTGYAYPMAET